MTAVPLSLIDLAIAAVLLLINAGLSVWFRLGLEQRLGIAALRMVMQLGAVGFILKFVFEQASPPLTLLIGCVMVAVAGLELIGRSATGATKALTFGIGTVTLFCAGLIGTFYALALVVQPEPWYAPRYALPILGMVLGNALTGVSLVFETMTAMARREVRAIEARLALGATRFEALQAVRSQALTSGLIPILNAMSVAGVVSLPGMMTGQIIAGADPVEAAKYQIMIMFIIAGSTGLAVLAAAFGATYLLTDSRHRLLAHARDGAS
jgi:putative ABC transport system permease protein